MWGLRWPAGRLALVLWAWAGFTVPLAAGGAAGRLAAADGREAALLLAGSSAPLPITLPAPDWAESGLAPASADDPPRPARLGWSRDLPLPYRETLPFDELAWEPVADGGMAATVVVRSSGARALRLAVSAVRLPAGVEVRFSGEAGAQRVFGPFSARELLAGDGGLFWSPVVEGESIGLEIHLPAGIAPSELSLALPEVAHLEASPWDPMLKADTSCLIDTACHSPVWGATAASVARLIFTIGRATYTCTGTLIADSAPGTSVPYFLTARHCVGTQAVASTVTTFWFQESSSCGGTASGGIQRSGGATLLSTGLHTAFDYSLLRLNQAPPAGVTFAQWSYPGPAIEAGAAVVGISHPEGGPKKIAFGTLSSRFDGFPRILDVTWSAGGTMAGSSGSGLFAPGGKSLLGILSGGAGTCSSPPMVGLYISFDDILPVVSAWLLGQPLPGSLRLESLGPLMAWGSAGGPFQQTQRPVTLINTGGSTLQFTASASASWVSVTPVSGTLAPGESTSGLVTINAGAASLPPGVHEAVVDFAVPAGGTGAQMSVQLQIAGDLQVTPSEGYSAAGVPGSLAPSPRQYVLSNPGGLTLWYQVSTGQGWLALSPTSGSLPPGGSTVVTVSLAPAANNLAPGIYTGTISFDNTSGSGGGDTTRPALLTVASRTFPLTVVNVHPTGGKVVSSPAGIDCGSDCAESFAEGTQVELTAVPFSGALFEGWSGSGCSGTGSCRIVMDAAKSVTASFQEAGVALGNWISRADSLTATVRQAEWKYYYLDVPAGSERLDIALFDLAADLDLYVRFAEKPTLNGYTCRPYYGGLVREDCAISLPSAGRWWIGVNNWSTGTIGYTVRAGASRRALHFFTVQPCRTLDTRAGSPLVSGTVARFPVAGTCGVPLSARAVSVNVTVVGASGAGHLVLFAGDGGMPGTSTINFPDGRPRGNNAIVSLSGDGAGRLAAYPQLAGGGHIHLVVDVNGYFE